MAETKILILEDEGLIARDLQVTLHNAGYTVAGPVADGDAALKLAAQEPPDLVLSGVRLQGEMDGIQCAQLLRARYGMPVIYVTAHGDEANLGRARDTHPFGFLRKPIDDRELLDAVELALAHHHDMEQRMRAYEEDLLRSQQALHASEEQVRQAQKMESLGRLAGGIAHDFNNLLTVITGYTEMLLAHFAQDDATRPELEAVRDAADRASELTRQLLAFSRRQVVLPRVLDLNHVVADARRMLERVIGEDLDFTTTLSPHLRSVKADPGHVEQILMNLVVNARDAMPLGGLLTVETANQVLDEPRPCQDENAPPGSYVALSVRDTGSGIPPDALPRIFEPFFTTKEQGRGTGLGLSTVYGIVKMSGGYIAVRSVPDVGTDFSILFPAVDERANDVERRSPDTQELGGSETVLVVDDDAGIRGLAAIILRRRGYVTLEARDADEALGVVRLHDGPIHLVLTDMVMPRMNGIELVDRLKEIHPGIKALFMSGYTGDRLNDDGLLDPSTNLIEKPFKRVVLLGRVREILDQGGSRTDMKGHGGDGTNPDRPFQPEAEPA